MFSDHDTLCIFLLAVAVFLGARLSHYIRGNSSLPTNRGFKEEEGRPFSPSSNIIRLLQQIFSSIVPIFHVLGIVKNT